MAETFRSALTGPIATLRTPFTHQGEIDWPALRTMIDFDLHAGAKAIVITGGDSHLPILSELERARLHQTTCEHVDGRAIVVGADWEYSTSQCLAFADQCRNWGVDILMVKPPDWARSTTPATLALHYAAVAQRLPVMIVTNSFISRSHAFGEETIDRALDASDQIVSIKDDMGPAFAGPLCQKYSDRVAIWAGGQKANHIAIHRLGASGYLSTWLTFKPHVAWTYWNALQSGDVPGAQRIIDTIDKPFFDHILHNYAGGFDAALHGILEITGLAKRYRRAPHQSLTDSEMEQLAAFMAQWDVG